jgi:hypothetical protein
VLADVPQSQRARVADQQPEHAATTRWLANLPDGRVVDARGQELGEPLAVLVEYGERCVAGAGDVACGIEDPREDRAGVEVRYEGPRRV